MMLLWWRGNNQPRHPPHLAYFLGNKLHINTKLMGQEEPHDQKIHHLGDSIRERPNLFHERVIGVLVSRWTGAAAHMKSAYRG